MTNIRSLTADHKQKATDVGLRPDTYTRSMGSLITSSYLTWLYLPNRSGSHDLAEVYDIYANPLIHS